MSGCPVKLDSDEACLIAADWYEEHGDGERAQRMRAVLTFKFGDRVRGWVLGAVGGSYRVELVVVGRDEECLYVTSMRDGRVNSGTWVEALAPDACPRARLTRRRGPWRCGHGTRKRWPQFQPTSPPPSARCSAIRR
jgi:hypothetical protein